MLRHRRILEALRVELCLNHNIFSALSRNLGGKLVTECPNARFPLADNKVIQNFLIERTVVFFLASE